MQGTICCFFLIFLYHITDLGLCFSGADRWKITGDTVVGADLGRTQILAPLLLFLFFSIFDFINLIFLNILFFSVFCLWLYIRETRDNIILYF